MSQIAGIIVIQVKVEFVPNSVRRVSRVERKATAMKATVAEAIELNVTKEISLGKCATVALRTNILTELVTAQMIVGRDSSERDLVAIDVQKDILEKCILTKGTSVNVTLGIGTPPIIETWAIIAVVFVPTQVVPILMGRILEISRVEIGKADSAMRVLAETATTGEAKGAGSNIVQREWMEGVAILTIAANGVSLLSFAKLNTRRRGSGRLTCGGRCPRRSMGEGTIFALSYKNNVKNYFSHFKGLMQRKVLYGTLVVEEMCVHLLTMSACQWE